MIIQGATISGASFHTLGLVTSGLTMWLDANNPASYPGSGSTWTDLSGNGADQTLVNSPSFVSGAPCYFEFDGYTQYSTGSMPVLGANQYTKMVWFQINSYASDNNLVSSFDGGHFMYTSLTSSLWSGNANHPPYSAHPDAFGSQSILSMNTWYCATVVFYNPMIYLYINGVQDAFDFTYTNTYRGGDGSTNLACFQPGTNLLNGRIAEVYTYINALSASQVLQNFNATRERYGV